MGQPSTPHEWVLVRTRPLWVLLNETSYDAEALLTLLGGGAGQQVRTGLGARWARATLAILLLLSTPQPAMKFR